MNLHAFGPDDPVWEDAIGCPHVSQKPETNQYNLPLDPKRPTAITSSPTSQKHEKPASAHDLIDGKYLNRGVPHAGRTGQRGSDTPNGHGSRTCHQSARRRVE